MLAVIKIRINRSRWGGVPQKITASNGSVVYIYNTAPRKEQISTEKFIFIEEPFGEKIDWMRIKGKHLHNIKQSGYSLTRSSLNDEQYIIDTSFSGLKDETLLAIEKEMLPIIREIHLNKIL